MRTHQVKFATIIGSHKQHRFNIHRRIQIRHHSSENKFNQFDIPPSCVQTQYLEENNVTGLGTYTCIILQDTELT